MELISIRGGTKEELEARKYTIGVGISLGNKWFTPENIADLVNWAFRFSKDRVIVYVADSIHALNIESRNGKSPEKSLEMALALGEEILNATREVVRKMLPEDLLKKVAYVKWSELQDEKYLKKVKYLYSFFDNDRDFHKKITGIVHHHIEKEKRNFNDDALKKMAYYALEELPELLCRVKMGKYECDAYAYPFDGELTELAEQIQKGGIFPFIKKAIIDTEPKVFLEVR